MGKTVDKLYSWRGIQTDTPPESPGRKFLDTLVDVYGVPPRNLDIGFEMEDGKPVPDEARNDIVRLAEGVDFTFRNGYVLFFWGQERGRISAENLSPNFSRWEMPL